MRKNRNQAMKYGFAVVAVFAVALGAWWWWTRPVEAGDDDDETVGRRSARPKEVTPAVSTNAASGRNGTRPVAEKVKGSERPYPPEAYWPDGRLKQHSRYVKVVTNHFNKARLSFAEKVFKAGANRDIAYLLTARPGAPIVGEIEYGEKFTKRFLKSLETPIVIEPDDPEEVVELKRAVRDTKVELKARYDAGEDIGKIMADTRKEMKELSLYRAELESILRKERAESKGQMTAAEMKDLIEAANVMLKDRGAEPLSMPSMMIRSMELRDARRAQRNKNRGE